MFALFQSIFGAHTTGKEQYPERLVKEAIERAVDGVDARLRVLGGYRKRLRPSIIQAIDHVVALVDPLPPCIDVSRTRYGKDPYVTALFASADDLQQFFSRERGVQEYLDSLTGPVPDRISGLLMMDRNEKRVYGAELEGDILRRDVPQMTVSFNNRKLLDPNGEEQETRRALKRRAFDHLIALALKDVIDTRAERQELEQNYTLLSRKLATFEAEGWGFDPGGAEINSDHAAAQLKLDEIEAQLEALPARTELLDSSLDALVNVFSHSPEKLYSVLVTVIIDRMNVVQKSVSDSANELLLNEFHSAKGLIRTGLMVSYPTGELLPRKKFLSY